MFAAPPGFDMTNNNLTELWDAVLRHNVQTTFEALDDADVTGIGGDFDRFVAILQARYGYTPEHAGAEIDAFMRKYNTFDNSQTGAMLAQHTTNPDGDVF